MKKVLMVLMTTVFVIPLISFDGRNSKIRSVDEITNEINQLLPDSGMVKVTPEILNLCFELQDAVNHQKGGPNITSIGFCWQDRCIGKTFDIPCPVGSWIDGCGWNQSYGCHVFPPGGENQCWSCGKCTNMYVGKCTYCGD